MQDGGGSYNLRDVYRSVIIGCGLIAGGYDDRRVEGAVRTHALAYQLNRRTRLVAVADASADVAQAFAMHWNVDSWFADIDEMLRVVQPDLVSVCTPDQTHVRILERCLDAGSVKGVWCEKPLTTNTADARRLVNEFRKRDKVLLVNYPRGYAPVICRYKERLLLGDFGSVQKVVVYYTKGIMHNGSHALDLLIDWFGVPDEAQVIHGHIDYTIDDPTVDAFLLFGDVPVYMMGLDEACYSQFEIDVFCTDARLSLVQNGTKVVLRELQQGCGPGGNRYLSEQFSEEDTGANHAIADALDSLVKSIDGDGGLSQDTHVLNVMDVCEGLARKGRVLLEENSGE